MGGLRRHCQFNLWPHPDSKSTAQFLIWNTSWSFWDQQWDALSEKSALGVDFYIRFGSKEGPQDHEGFDWYVGGYGNRGEKEEEDGVADGVGGFDARLDSGAEMEVGVVGGDGSDEATGFLFLSQFPKGDYSIWWSWV